MGDPKAWLELTKLEINYVTNFLSSTNNFFRLSKIRKFALILEATVKQNNECVEVLEPSYLKLFILHLETSGIIGSVRNNIYLSELCLRINYENTILATFDVIDLRTNIPHAHGLKRL